MYIQSLHISIAQFALVLFYKISPILASFNIRSEISSLFPESHLSGFLKIGLLSLINKVVNPHNGPSAFLVLQLYGSREMEYVDKW